MKILPTLAFCSAALRWVLGNLCGDKKKCHHVWNIWRIYSLYYVLC